MNRPVRARARIRVLDAAPALLREGYAFVGRRCDRLGTDVFTTRLLGRPTIFLRGVEAARLFYDGGRFLREGGLPRRVRSTLVGHGTVQGLDGVAHHHRKAMLLATLRPASVDDLLARAGAGWDEAADRWPRRSHVVLLQEAHALLAHAVLGWAGVPLDGLDVPRLTRELVALYQSGGKVGPRHWRGRAARARLEAWAGLLIEDVRDGRVRPHPDSALATVAHHHDLDGDLLGLRVAAAELLNLLRPTVAVGRYVTFLGLELHRHPTWRERLAASDDDVLPFVQEVRRTAPFFPMVAARVREDFTWNGHPFPAGTRTLLDLYGTNRDPRAWPEPDAFFPERFRGWPGDPFTLIPQGGGDTATGHRCAGEATTIALMRQAVVRLARHLDWEVPEQDLRVSLRRVPAKPASGLVLERVRAR
jgi:fatty-acid peroxygenase